MCGWFSTDFIQFPSEALICPFKHQMNWKEMLNQTQNYKISIFYFDSSQSGIRLVFFSTPFCCSFYLQSPFYVSKIMHKRLKIFIYSLFMCVFSFFKRKAYEANDINSFRKWSYKAYRMLVVLGWPNAHTMPSPKFIQHLHMLNVSSMIKGICIKEKYGTLNLKEWFHRMKMNARRAKPKRIWWKVFLSYSIFFFMVYMYFRMFEHMHGICVYFFFFSCQLTNQRKTSLIRYHPGALPFKRLSLFSLILSYTHIKQRFFISNSM